MKPMNSDDGESTPWLGFSLSPHLNMEVPLSSYHRQRQNQAPADSAFGLSTPTLDYGLLNGVAVESFCSCSASSVMPLKSDGSLCLMEALHKSQARACATPPSEDFFSGATMSHDLEKLYHLEDPQDQEHNHQNHLNHIYWRKQHLAQTPCQQYRHLSSEEFVSRALLHQIPSNDALEKKMMNGSMMGHGGSGSCPVSTMASGDSYSLSLSMSPQSQPDCITSSQQIADTIAECIALETKKRGVDNFNQKKIVHRKSLDTFGQRTSQYRGVTRHRWTGRYEAHLWDSSCKKEGQSRKGRQVYLGGYDREEKAARAYDLAALKYWGPSTHLNFALDNYQQELEEMKNMSRQEHVAHLRRKSSGFSRGASMYRGVTRHHQHGRWQARIGRVAGNKDLYLGTFSTQEAAAEAYDIAAIKFRGANAVTNFDMSRYDVEQITASSTLLPGEMARRDKEIASKFINEASGH
ncbi:uncharacterized protein J3R85_011284 [Psidium guajava]|nr:uncharacterized protein J3R85_011284 [Psidium guajava]